MFDAQLRPLIDRLLDPIGRGLVRLGATANQVTLIGVAFGLIAAGCVAAGLFHTALWFVIANRVCLICYVSIGAISTYSQRTISSGH